MRNERAVGTIQVPPYLPNSCKGSSLWWGRTRLPRAPSCSRAESEGRGKHARVILVRLYQHVPSIRLIPRKQG